MITDNNSECDFLRELLKSPQFGLPEYMADPIVQRRVGKAIAEASTIGNAGQSRPSRSAPKPTFVRYAQ